MLACRLQWDFFFLLWSPPVDRGRVYRYYWSHGRQIPWTPLAFVRGCDGGIAGRKQKTKSRRIHTRKIGIYLYTVCIRKLLYIWWYRSCMEQKNRFFKPNCAGFIIRITATIIIFHSWFRITNCYQYQGFACYEMLVVTKMKHHQPALCQIVARIARNKRRVVQPNCVGFRITIAISLRILFFMKCWWSPSETSLTSTVPDGCKDCMEFLREQFFLAKVCSFGA